MRLLLSRFPAIDECVRRTPPVTLWERERQEQAGMLAESICIILLAFGKTRQPFRCGEQCFCHRGNLHDLIRFDSIHFISLDGGLVHTQSFAKAAIIKDKQEVTIPMLKAELDGIKGLFKGKECKTVEAEIQAAEQEVSDLKKEISDMVKKAGYPDGQTFMAAYNKAEKIVKQYKADLAEWERRTQQPIQAEPQRPPEKRSIIEQLRQIQTEAKQKPRNTPKRNRDDWER